MIAAAPRDLTAVRRAWFTARPFAGPKKTPPAGKTRGGVECEPVLPSGGRLKVLRTPEQIARHVPRTQSQANQCFTPYAMRTSR